MRLRSTTAVLASATVAVATLTGCQLTDRTPDVDPAAQAYAEALQAGVIGEEVNEQGAQPDADRIFSEADDFPRTVTVSEAAPADGDDPQQATATLHWSWDLSSIGVQEPWEYDTEATFAREGDEWFPEWDTTTVHPDLTSAEPIEFQTIEPTRGDIVGAGGTPLITSRDVVSYGIARSEVPRAQAAASARRLAQALDIDVPGYVKRVNAAGDKAFVVALMLRPGDVPLDLDATVADIPGARALLGHKPLGPTAEFARPILGSVGEVTAEMIDEDPSLQVGDQRGLSGLEARYDDELAGTPGWQAVAGSSELGGADATDGTALEVSVDEDLQLTAEKLLADVDPAAAIVAIRPSDGAILAAANGPGTGGVNIATYGQAAPGSTFKIVSTLALLRSGLTPDSPVRCPASVVVDGKRFENYDDYPSNSLGRLPLRLALAKSCNTAFIGEVDAIDDGVLAQAAATLGLGVDHDLGFPAYFGQIPAPTSQTEAAADLIGQGGVLASPMVMATVMATIVKGETVVPWLVDDVRSTGTDAPPLTAAETRQMRAMLRGVVTDGSGVRLLDVPGPPVLAKTGTAEFDRDGARLLHAWMVAGQGDLAVAVYVDEGSSGSQTAGPILEEFLRQAR